MNKTLIIASWELTERLKRKSFWFATLLIPFFILTITSFPLMNGDSLKEVNRITIGLLDKSNSLSRYINILTREFNRRNSKRIELMNFSGVDLMNETQLDSMLAKSGIDASVVIAKDGRTIFLKYTNVRKLILLKSFETILIKATGMQNVFKLNLPFDIQKKLLEEPLLKEIRINNNNMKSNYFRKNFITYFAVTLVFISIILFSGGMLIRGFADEKSNSLIEVLMTSASLNSILIGKSFGMFLLNLIQIIIWILIGAVFYGGNNLVYLTLAQFAVLTALFLSGYFSFTLLFVSLGVFARTDQDAQQFLALLSFVIVLPLVSVLTLWNNPGGIWQQIMLYFPLTSVQTILLKIGLRNYSNAEIFIAIVINFILITTLVFLVKKYFRKGVIESV